MKILGLLLLFSLIFSSCEFRKKEAQLQEKETALNQKEEKLLLMEKNLRLKEESLLQRELKLDSSFHTDSISITNPQVIGNWAANMVCTQTSCEGSAVGDTKTELWQISYEGPSVVAKATFNSQLVRVYTGTYTPNGLELTEAKANTPSTSPLSRMIVRLKMSDSTHMTGQREITRGNCSILYNLQLQKVL